MPAHMPPSFEEEIARYKRALEYAKTVTVSAAPDHAIVLMAPFFQHYGHILMPVPEGFGLSDVWPRTGIVLSVGRRFVDRFPVEVGDELLFDKLQAVEFFGSSNPFADHSDGTNVRDRIGILQAHMILGRIEHDLEGQTVRWLQPGQAPIPDEAPWPMSQQAVVVEEDGAYGGLAICKTFDNVLIKVPYQWMVRDERGNIQTF